MTTLGLMLGTVGTDVNTGAARFTFGILELYGGIEIVALALGLFGLAEFIRNVNRLAAVHADHINVRLRDMRPSRADLTAGGAGDDPRHPDRLPLFAHPGHRPDDRLVRLLRHRKKVSRTPERFGHGAIEGVACPEAATHSSCQGDFIPTMCLGIPGDAVMALILGALMIQGITPGPQLITEQPDIFWGLIASFWVGNILLLVLNVPLIGLWVKLLQVPYRLLYPVGPVLHRASACSAPRTAISTSARRIVVGVVGYILHRLGLPSGADPAGLHPRPEGGGELPPRDADFGRRPRLFHAAADQRRGALALPRVAGGTGRLVAGPAAPAARHRRRGALNSCRRDLNCSACGRAGGFRRAGGGR